MSVWLLILFAFLALLGIPLSLSLGLAAVTTFWWFDLPLSMVTQAMATSINSFLLIAVPLGAAEAARWQAAAESMWAALSAEDPEGDDRA